MTSFASTELASFTAQSVRDVFFQPAFRGYSEQQVDEFLDFVAYRVDELHARVRELTDRSDRAEAQPGDGAMDEAVRKTLVLAQRAADLVVSEAKTVAERIVAEAELQADVIRRNAEASAAALSAQVLADAQTQAEIDRRSYLDETVAKLGEASEVLEATLAEAEVVTLAAEAAAHATRGGAEREAASVLAVAEGRRGEIVATATAQGEYELRRVIELAAQRQTQLEADQRDLTSSVAALEMRRTAVREALHAMLSEHLRALDAPGPLFGGPTYASVSPTNSEEDVDGSAAGAPDGGRLIDGYDQQTDLADFGGEAELGRPFASGLAFGPNERTDGSALDPIV